MAMSNIPANLGGQYIGNYTNMTHGKYSFLCVNIDHIGGSHHEAYATIFSGDRIYTTTFPFDWTNSSQGAFINVTQITEYIRQGNGTFNKSEGNVQQYKSADLHITWEKWLRLTWTTDNQESMQSEGLITAAAAPSELRSIIVNWQDFKKEVGDVGPLRRYIFRGQSLTNRLRTSYHRTNRSNIARYYKENVPELQHFMSSAHKDYLSLTELSDLISMLTLAQHHGYPTPILDWTKSPYIAAYFAFINVSCQTAGDCDDALDSFIRIYKIDLEEYQNDFPQFMDVNDMNLHVSFVITPPANNPRAIPQQSISCISTIDDIETYIAFYERNMHKKYLFAYDIPTSEANNALKDLELMGITHAALFPGLDGISRYLRWKHFENT
ncbi:FRG domain-containing protein [Acidithiobacillus montserratensis]|uniref:FRG domain-containing protein n=1 Tax=Acidithiobacillus montserratensis TaxID=2729135 RepID=A0ACD5HBM6_9PROT|nr:FRG domain-containing protein [Acidithiobacillus montserratensis]MBU2748247.1 FRG domain-containing protein [Acidithiobacillus montserratensis]